MTPDHRQDRAAERCRNGPPSEINCRQIAELLADYLDGTLPKAQRKSIEWHIDSCAPCVAFVNTYRATVNAVRRLRDLPRTANITVNRSTPAARNLPCPPPYAGAAAMLHRAPRTREGPWPSAFSMQRIFRRHRARRSDTP